MPDQTRIFDGARLGPASDLADYCGAVGEWAQNTWIADFPEQQSIWESAFPFLDAESERAARLRELLGQ